MGDGVQRLVVAGGLNLSNSLLRSMLILCPNVQHLDISYTNITDLAFRGYVLNRTLRLNCILVTFTFFLWSLAAKNACVQLEHLDFTACRYVTDVGLERLGACFKSPVMSEKTYASKCGACCVSCKQCPKYYLNKLQSENDLLIGASENKEKFSPGLRYLSLSGCISVTDFGLRALLDVTLETDSLRYMDLSGCPLVSGLLLRNIIENSTRLLPQDLYYCNRIEEGPYPDEANGCQNLECPVRGCCCFDQ